MKRRCVVCENLTGSERNRLCRSCLQIAEHYYQTVIRLQEKQPKWRFANLMASLTGSYHRLPQSQLEQIKGLVADCETDGVAVSSSEVIRLALHYGLLALSARTSEEIGAAVQAHHQNYARIKTEGLQSYR